MSIAVVNEEMPGSICTTWDEGCLIFGDTGPTWVGDWVEGEEEVMVPAPSKNYSCRFLSHIDPEVLRLVYFDDYDEAYETVRHAKNWGLIHFNSNYTEALLDRLTTIGGTIMAEVSGIGVAANVHEESLLILI